MSHRDLKKYSEACRAEWPGWVRASPLHWRDDKFIVLNSPLSAMIRYGQDEVVGDMATLHEDAASWDRERDTRHCRSMWVALATHLRCDLLSHSMFTVLTLASVDSAKKVDRWVNIPDEDLEHHGPLYDRWTSIDRQPVDLATLPVLDEDGEEIPVFEESGRQIPRREAHTLDTRPPCGVLVDLANIRDFFDDPRGIDYMAEAQGSPAPAVIVNAYRQGFLHSAGHVQVNAVPYPMVPLIADINASVAIDAAAQDDDEDDEDHVPLPLSAVSPVDCQMYNAVMHRVRGTASTHDAQRGDITAALAGSYSQGVTQKRTATRLIDSCNVRLPHENFRQIISHNGLEVGLRMECVHHIELTKLRDDRQSGAYVNPPISCFTITDDGRHCRCIYVYIIVPIANTWSHPHLFSYLKDHIIVFRPRVRL